MVLRALLFHPASRAHAQDKDEVTFKVAPAAVSLAATRAHLPTPQANTIQGSPVSPRNGSEGINHFHGFQRYVVKVCCAAIERAQEERHGGGGGSDIFIPQRKDLVPSFRALLFPSYMQESCPVEISSVWSLGFAE